MIYVLCDFRSFRISAKPGKVNKSIAIGATLDVLRGPQLAEDTVGPVTSGASAVLCQVLQAERLQAGGNQVGERPACVEAEASVRCKFEHRVLSLSGTRSRGLDRSPEEMTPPRGFAMLAS